METLTKKQMGILKMKQGKKLKNKNEKSNKEHSFSLEYPNIYNKGTL